jgi:hypothetical protein
VKFQSPDNAVLSLRFRYVDSLFHIDVANHPRRIHSEFGIRQSSSPHGRQKKDGAFTYDIKMRWEYVSEHAWWQTHAVAALLSGTRVVLVTTWRGKWLRNYSGCCPENLRPLQQALQLAERKMCWGGVKLGERPIDVSRFQASSLVMCMTILLKLIFIFFSYEWSRLQQCMKFVMLEKMWVRFRNHQ